MFVQRTCTFPSSPPPSDLSFPFLTLSSPAGAPPAPACPLPLSFNLQMLFRAARLRSHQGVPSLQQARALTCAGWAHHTEANRQSKSPCPHSPHLKKGIKMKSKSSSKKQPERRSGRPVWRLLVLNVRLIAAVSLRPRSGLLSDNTHTAAATMSTGTTTRSTRDGLERCSEHQMTCLNTHRSPRTGRLLFV